jgi:hypothetical protein
MEEIDLCWRAKKIGYHFKVAPNSRVYHVGGGTLPYSSPKKTFLNFRNSLYMIIKNHEGWLFPKLVQRLCIDAVAGTRFLLIGEFKQLWAVLNAHFWMYKKLPSFLKKRKYIRENSTHTDLSGIYKGGILWARYFKKTTRFSELNQRLFTK